MPAAAVPGGEKGAKKRAGGLIFGFARSFACGSGEDGGYG